MNFQLTVGFSLGYMYFHMFKYQAEEREESGLDLSFLKSCRCWALESHYTVLLSPGVDILSNLNYFPVSRDRNLTKKLQKNSNAALFPLAPPPPPSPPKNLSI